MKSAPDADLKEAHSVSEFIQVGVTALRNPDGSFQPSIPLYVRRDQTTEQGREAMLKAFAAMMAPRIKDEK